MLNLFHNQGVLVYLKSSSQLSRMLHHNLVGCVLIGGWFRIGHYGCTMACEPAMPSAAR